MCVHCTLGPNLFFGAARAPRLPELNVGEMDSDDDSDSGLCALEGCGRPKEYENGCDWDRCCKRCFISEGEEHDPCCDRRARDNGQRSLEETENSMTAAEEDGPTAAARPAAAEEDAAASTASQVNKRCERTYWAARAAAYGASQENDVCKNDVCSYCKYRGRKLKHTQDS